ncbi:PAS domain-containing protein [Phormidium tenue FACHB-886]|nr:PAS domain-containing protein [Phormidium tenue FACHB-886]
MLEPNFEDDALARLNATIAQLQQQITHLEQENDSLRSDLESCRSQQQGSQSQVVELQRSLDQLAESEERFRTLFEISSEGLYYVEFDPPYPVNLSFEEQCDLFRQNLRVVKVNSAFAAMYGFDNPDELVGLKIADVHIEGSEKNDAFIRAIVENGYRGCNLETEEIDRQGRIRYFLNSGIATIKDGYVVSAWATQVDITELKEAQQALLEAEQKRAAELAEVNAEILEREREKAVLLSISQTIATVRDKYDLLQLIIERIKPLFNFYDCAIPLIGQDGKYYCDFSDLTLNTDNPGANEYLNEAGFNQDGGIVLQGSTLESLMQQIEATGHPVIFDYEQDCTGYSDAHLLQAFQDLGYKEGLATLLKAGGKVFGCLIINALEKPFFPSEQFSLFQAIADQVAVAIANIMANEAVLTHEKALQRIEQERANELERRVQERTAELNYTNALLDTLFETAPVGFAFLDFEQRYIRINQALAKINGIDAQAHIGQPIHSMLPQMSAEFAEDLRQVAETREPILEKEVYGETPAAPGQQRYWLASYYPIRAANQQELGLGAIILEITERKRAEIQLQQLSTQLEERVQERTLQLAQTIERLNEEIAERRLAEQLARGQSEVLLRVLTGLANKPSLDAILGEVLAAIVTGLSLQAGSIWLWNERNAALEVIADVDDDRIRLQSELDRTIYRIPLQPDEVEGLRQSRYFINDRQELEANPICAAYRSLLSEEIRSILTVPLLSSDALIGCLSVRSSRAADFSTEELELASVLAYQATLAIQLIQLAEDAKQAAILEDRNQLAGEIHDTLAQTFTGISVQLELAQFLIHHNLAEVETILDRIGELTQMGLAEARRSVWALHSTSEDYADLAQNLSHSVERMTQGMLTHAEMTISGAPYLLPPFIGKNVLRIGQEAITNVLKHAQADYLWVELAYAADQVILRVKDNGCGFSPQGTADGFGLISMSERADRINGQLTITSQPGNGTEILVRSPSRFHQLTEADAREQ